MQEKITGLAYGEDWENNKRRWDAFWRCDVFDRPVMRITAPRCIPIKPLLEEAAYSPRFNILPELEFHNFRQMYGRTLYTIAHNYYFGEALPVFDHKWSVAQALAWGCKPEYNEFAAWCHPVYSIPDEPAPFYADENGEGWRWMLETTRSAVKEARRNYYVRPDWGNHTGDILTTLIGNFEMLTMAAVDKLRLKRLINDVSVSLNHLYKEMYAILEMGSNEGTLNYIGCWSPARCICLDCDISCMLSSEMFNSFFVDEIITTMAIATHRIYHLDGPGALHHLPTLLGINELHGIQWVPGAGKEDIAQWIPLLQKIQKAHKSLLINIVADELPLVLHELNPEGLCITMSAGSADEAMLILDKVKI